MDTLTPLPREINDSELRFLAQCLKTTHLAQVRAKIAQFWHQISTSGEVIRYGCISEFTFLNPSVTRRPIYFNLLSQAQEARAKGERPRWLEVGCAFGTDVRKVILDGWPRDDILALDVVPTYWNYGLSLFGDTANPPCEFLCADLTTHTLPISISPVDVAYTNLVLHVLTRPQTVYLVVNIFSLLNPGGCFWGHTLGNELESSWSPYGNDWWLHSEKSLRNLLEEAGFVDVKIFAKRLNEIGKQVNLSEQFRNRLKDRGSRGGMLYLFNARKAI